MKATFNYIRIENLELLNTIETGNIIQTLSSGVMIESRLFPNGKFIESKNLISID